MIKIAIDAMGGDFAPDKIIDGAICGLKQNNDVEIFLYGKSDLIESSLKKHTLSEEEKNRVKIINCTEVIGCDEAPVLAIRNKKDSSLVVASRDLKESKADALISAGSSGAILACGTLIVGRIKNVERPGFGAMVPVKDGICLLLDSGANAECKSEFLNQFATLGTIYYKEMFGVKNPRLALLNIGTEEEKGNQLVKETNELLKNNKNINYIGYIEGREAIFGGCDILISDGFSGNVFIKSYEGIAKLLINNIKSLFYKNLKTKLGALLIKDDFKKMLSSFDYKKHGGAPIIGLEKIFIKVHGNTQGEEITNAIYQAKTFIKNNVNEKIASSLKE